MQSSPASFAESRRRSAADIYPPKEKKVIITDTYFNRGVEMADHIRGKQTKDVTLLIADRKNEAALANLRREFEGCINRALKHYDPTRQELTVIMNYFTSVNARIWETLRAAEENKYPAGKILVSCLDEGQFPFLAQTNSRVRHILYNDDRGDYLEQLDGQLGI